MWLRRTPVNVAEEDPRNGAKEDPGNEAGVVNTRCMELE